MVPPEIPPKMVLNITASIPTIVSPETALRNPLKVPPRICLNIVPSPPKFLPKIPSDFFFGNFTTNSHGDSLRILLDNSFGSF